MAEIINLNKARKQRAKDSGVRTAAEHRATFGESKSVRQTRRGKASADDRKLDAHRLDKDA